MGDWLLAAAVAAAHAGLAGKHVLVGHSADQRMSIYATVASVAAIIGGFGTAAISQYASSSGSRMTFLRARFGPSLRRNWVSILTSMSAVAIGCLGVMIYDARETIGWGGWLVEFLLLLGAARTARLIWLFRLLIDVSDHDGTNIGNYEEVRVAARSPSQVQDPD